MPQIFGQFNDYSVAQAFQIKDKLGALEEILSGIVTTANLALLNYDWTIEERCKRAFMYWQLNGEFS